MAKEVPISDNEDEDEVSQKLRQKTPSLKNRSFPVITRNPTSPGAALPPYRRARRKVQTSEWFQREAEDSPMVEASNSEERKRRTEGMTSNGSSLFLTNLFRDGHEA